jgi:membrane dipeptidase
MSDYLRKIKQDSQRVALVRELRSEYDRYSKMTDEEHQDLWARWEEVNQKYPAKLATVKDLVDHIDHIVRVAGIDHVGIGSDFDGGGRIDGCQDVSEMGNITLELVRRDYTKEQISKIWGGNFLRVFGEVERIAAQM